jgi:adenylate cyclase
LKQLGSSWLGRSRSARWGRAVLLVLLMPLIATFLGRLRFLEIVELKTEDLRYRQRDLGPIHPDLLIVEIDDQTIEQYGGLFPLPRTQHAVLLNGLVNAGALVVAFDFLFSTPAAETMHDQLLANVMSRNAGHVVLATHFRSALEPTFATTGVPGGTAPLPDTLTTPGILPGVYGGTALDLPYELYQQSGVGLGHITFLEHLEADGSVRRAPLLLQYGEALVPAFGLVCWLQSRGLRLADVRVDVDSGWLVDRQGARLLQLPPSALFEIDYAGGVDHFDAHRMSYVQALGLIFSASQSDSSDAAAQLEKRFQNKIILVGLTAKSSYSVDLGVTPFSAGTPLLYAHANLVNNLLLEREVRRSPAWAGLLAASLLLLFSAGVGPSLRPTTWVLLNLAVLLAGALATQQLFSRAAIMVDLVPPVLVFLLGAATAAVTAYIGQEKERQILRRTFDAYVSPDLMEGILENAGRIELGGTLKPATVLFLDIRGFTAWTRSMQPQQLVQELNEFLAGMVDVIFETGGAVNKFLGDAILAVFGAPIEHDDDACRAVTAAITMHERLAAHNRERSRANLPEIRLGIGIATGSVVAGNVGSSQRLEFTVIGNAVNLASRLQGLSSDNQILLDRPTADLVRDALPNHQLESIGERTVKGIDEPIEVFEVKPRHSSAARRA